MKIWRSEGGLTVAIDDAAGTVTLSDALALNAVEIDRAGKVTVKGVREIVNAATIVKEGGEMATHPGVLGDQLLAYIGQLVTLFNTHVHPGELAAGFIPVTPAPPVAPMPPPSPSLLSRKVLLE